MEVQSKQGPMVGWVGLIGLVKQCLYKGRKNHTWHRDKFKQSTADVYR